MVHYTFNFHKTPWFGTVYVSNNSSAYNNLNKGFIIGDNRFLKNETQLVDYYENKNWHQPTKLMWSASFVKCNMEQVWDLLSLC